MQTTPPARRADLLALASSVLFLILSVAAGALLGGVFVRLFVPRANNGWDGMAQVLGGLMVGGLIAVVVAAALLVPLFRRGRKALLWACVSTLAVGLLAFGSLMLLRPEKGQTTTPTTSTPSPTPTVPVPKPLP